MSVSPIRYPGSKAKLYTIIRDALPEEATTPLWGSNLTGFCEPFFGSGAIGWQLLQDMARVPIILGDVDLYLCHLWDVCRRAPRALCRMLRERMPKLEEWEVFKADDGNPNVEPVEAAYRKLVLHNCSWSGLGAMAGSVLGGRNQRSAYSHRCRWNANKMRRKVQKLHEICNRFPSMVIRQMDFAESLALLPDAGISYLDPPYYKQGEALYKFPMTDADHARLAGVLRVARFRFLLSYDNHPRIRELYGGWASIREITMTPSVATVSKKPRRKNQELLISNW